MVIMLSGCTSFAIREMPKVDSAIAKIAAMDMKSLTPEMRAGFARGISSGATVPPDIDKTIMTMEETCDMSNPDYKSWKNLGAWLAFKVRAGKAKIDDVLKDVMLLGVLP